MVLASIISVWDGVELLKYAIESTRKRVDFYVIVWQDVSNFGEKYNPRPEIERICELFPETDFHFSLYTPRTVGGFSNEVEKRNRGIEIAQNLHATHFFFQDCDEIYENFSTCVDEYIERGTEGSVCPIYTYYKLPTLRFENPDNYFVPFIHKLRPDTVAGSPNYPFYVDPTRSTPCRGTAKLNHYMHHFSYIRRDIGRKLRNSSAKANLKVDTIMRDLELAAPGYYVDHIFRQKLIEVPNQFGIEI